MCTKKQIVKIHVLLRETGMIDEKKALVSHLTAGRTNSTKDLTNAEAHRLIEFLQGDNDGRENLRRKVFSVAYDAGLIYGDTDEDKRMNAAKLQAFILKSGTVKKQLNEMTKAELVRTINQMEQIVKHNQQTQANKATRELLNQLNITTQKRRYGNSNR